MPLGINVKHIPIKMFNTQLRGKYIMINALELPILGVIEVRTLFRLDGSSLCALINANAASSSLFNSSAATIDLLFYK